MLNPEDLRIRRTLHEAMYVLSDRIELVFFRSIFGSHSLAAQIPRFSRIVSDPHAAGGNADVHVTRIARIDADGMDARPLRAVRSPFLAPRMIPERTIQLPRVAIVFRFEETAGHRAGPDQSRLIGAAWRKAPDQLQRPVECLSEEWNRFGDVAFGHRWILRRGDFLPGFAVIRR